MSSLPSHPENDPRFRVNHAASVVRILHEVRDAKGIVYISVDYGQDFLLSAIVEVDEKQGVLFLEQGVDQEFNQQILTAGRIFCTSTHDQVHVEFIGTQVKAARLGNEAVFQVTLPTEMLRLQRRQSYRLATPLVEPVKCQINLGEENFLQATVVDISIGGIGILSYAGKGLLQNETTYHGCRIELPGTGTFALSLMVRNTYDVTLRNGRTTHRAGCQFIDLPASVETDIQRYINRVQRERRARYV